MIIGGNATLFVSDFDGAVKFYTEALGLELRFRAENHWAEVLAGPDLVIGIHPVTPNTPGGGLVGSVQIGLSVDEPLETVMATLGARGVAFEGGIIEDEKAGNRFANLKDPEGNCLYLWETVSAPQP